MSKKNTSVPVSTEVLTSFRPAKNLSHHERASVTSLDFDDSGQFLISSGVDKTIQLYDCYKGTRHKEVQSQKYGAHLARFTHADFSCLYASTPVVGEDADHSIRFLSLKTKAYLRYFRGHKDQVVSLEVNPVSETFLLASMDHTVKLWDLRTLTPMGNIGTGQKCHLAYDPHGLVFAAAKLPDSGSGSLELFDLALFERGPFITSPVETSGEAWTKVEFSNNGKYILIATDAAFHYILDAVQGVTIAKLVLKSGLKSKYPSSSACFTPDGKFVLAGAPGGSLSLFDLSVLNRKDLIREKRVQDLSPVSVLPSNQGMARVVAFNPKLFNIATADDSVVLWAPHDV